MDTFIHELCHNLLADHDADFYALWSKMNEEYGIENGEAAWKAGSVPPSFYPLYHIAIFVGGKKIHIERTAFRQHFPKLARKMPKCANAVNISKKHNPAAVTRLIQRAKGLNSADAMPLLKLSDVKDYWCNERDCLAFIDHFQSSGWQVEVAIKLYVQMFVIGSEFGMNPPTEKWLIELFGHAFTWTYRVGNGKWVLPWLPNRRTMSYHICDMAYCVYEETTSEHQALRRVVAEALKHLLTRPEEMAETYDTDLILELIRQRPDLREDMGLVGKIGGKQLRVCPSGALVDMQFVSMLQGSVE